MRNKNWLENTVYMQCECTGVRQAPKIVKIPDTFSILNTFFDFLSLFLYYLTDVPAVWTQIKWPLWS